MFHRLSHDRTIETYIKNDQLILVNQILCLQDIISISRFLNEHSEIKKLILRHNNIGPAGAKVLAQNTTLITLDLNENNIGMEGAIALAKNTTLRTLALHNNDIGLDGVIALAENNTLRELDLCYNNIDIEGIKNLADNKTLFALGLGANGIDSEDAIILARNTTLQILELQDNHIDVIGARALASNTTLKTLSLDGNVIGDEGAAAFLFNQTIEKLYLRNTSMTITMQAVMSGLNGLNILRRFYYLEDMLRAKDAEYVQLRVMQKQCARTDLLYDETSLCDALESTIHSIKFFKKLLSYACRRYPLSLQTHSFFALQQHLKGLSVEKQTLILATLPTLLKTYYQKTITKEMMVVCGVSRAGVM